MIKKMLFFFIFYFYFFFSTFHGQFNWSSTGKLRKQKINRTQVNPTLSAIILANLGSHYLG